MSEKLNGIIQQADQARKIFYTTNTKRSFFKKEQKIGCAIEVVNRMSLEELMENTAFIIPDTKSIYIEYPLFKMYAIPENYPDIIQYIIGLVQTTIGLYGCYDMHVNLDTFSVSAADRYRGFIDMIMNKCINLNSSFSMYLSMFYIYNTPTAIDMISSLLNRFIDPAIKSKIVYYSKPESKRQLEHLFVSADEYRKESQKID
jgi:hypothetical protein